MSTKRPRHRRETASPDRSPSPLLPAHLYSSLPAASSSSSSGAAQLHSGDSDPRLAHLALYAIEAREATLLDPRDWPVATRGAQVEWTGWVDSSDTDGEQKHVWTDRYDLLHLLPAIPAIPRVAPPEPVQSAPGFEDLPSDHEELFFLNSRAERADVERKKKRRRLEEERERRVQERMKEDGEEEDVEETASFSGDEPPKEIHLLMSRLHTTLSRSPNPALLELRILANHGSDARFASFLKREGKWRTVWERMRRGGGEGEVSQEVESGGPEQDGDKAPKPTTGLGGLADYGSDSDDDSVGDAADAGPPKNSEPSPLVASPSNVDTPSAPPDPPKVILPSPTDGDGTPTDDLTEEQRKRQEARAAKAREWAQRRREARAQEGVP